MPVYEVKGRAGDGGLERRRVTAADERDALRAVGDDGLEVLGVREIGQVRTVGDLPVGEFKRLGLGMCLLALLIWFVIGLALSLLFLLAG